MWISCEINYVVFQREEIPVGLPGSGALHAALCLELSEG